MITELGKISIGLNKQETANVYGREILMKKHGKTLMQRENIAKQLKNSQSIVNGKLVS